MEGGERDSWGGGGAGGGGGGLRWPNHEGGGKARPQWIGPQRGSSPRSAPPPFVVAEIWADKVRGGGGVRGGWGYGWDVRGGGVRGVWRFTH